MAAAMKRSESERVREYAERARGLPTSRLRKLLDRLPQQATAQRSAIRAELRRRSKPISRA